MGTVKQRNAMEKLMKLRGAINDYPDPHANVVRISRSPSVNFAFGNGHGLPAGYSLLLYGPNKGGKSLIAYDTIGALHEDDPEAVAVKWDTEFREKLQLTPQRAKMFGIDRSRYQCWSTNAAEDIFDRFEVDVASAIESGVKIRLAIIDSSSNILGRQEAKKESVNDFTIGDHAMTLQIGLKRILPVIRRYDIALILITHIRAEMDQEKVKRHETVKPQASWAVKHFAEYFGYAEKNEWKDGRMDGHGKEMVNTSLGDMREKGGGEQFAHKINFTMKASSAGPAGRRASFTYNYAKGVANVHEEVLQLAHARGLIVTKGSNYYYGETKWNGWDTALNELEANPALQRQILADLKARELSGTWANDEADDGSVPEIGVIHDAQPVT